MPRLLCAAGRFVDITRPWQVQLRTSFAADDRPPAAIHLFGVFPGLSASRFAEPLPAFTAQKQQIYAAAALCGGAINQGLRLRLFGAKERNGMGGGAHSGVSKQYH